MSGHGKPTPFVIFATQRTGSNWLMGMLDAHPDIAAYDELLLRGVSGNGYWGRTDLEVFESYYTRHRKHDNRASRAILSFRYLNELYAPRAGITAIGMKLMYDQLWQNPWLWMYLLRHRVRIVHLVRENLLDIVLSLETVEARKQPHAWQDQVVDTPVVTLDPQKAVSTLKMLEFRIKVARRLLALVPVSHFEVSYEQLMANPSHLNDVFGFLDVSIPQESTIGISRFKKLNVSRKEDLIANYVEIANVLHGTDFQHYLGE